MRAKPEHVGDAAEDHHGTERGQRGAHAAALDGRNEAALHRLSVAAALQLLEREGLHGLNGVEGFIDQTAGVGDPILRRAR